MSLGIFMDCNLIENKEHINSKKKKKEKLWVKINSSGMRWSISSGFSIIIIFFCGWYILSIIFHGKNIYICIYRYI